MRAENRFALFLIPLGFETGLAFALR